MNKMNGAKLFFLAVIPSMCGCAALGESVGRLMTPGEPEHAAGREVVEQAASGNWIGAGVGAAGIFLSILGVRAFKRRKGK